jgi:hypothetical protein
MDHMTYELDRQPQVEPSLLEMARTSTPGHERANVRDGLVT